VVAAVVAEVAGVVKAAVAAVDTTKSLYHFRIWHQVFRLLSEAAVREPLEELRQEQLVALVRFH
jgi:hypothetical protein